MDWLQALILGAIQGLTEYLPVSSSGHLTIGSYLFGVNPDDNLTFTVAVHVATVLSTLVILWKEVAWIFKGLFKCQMNEETRYVLNIDDSYRYCRCILQRLRRRHLRFWSCHRWSNALGNSLLVGILLLRTPTPERKDFYA